MTNEEVDGCGLFFFGDSCDGRMEYAREIGFSRRLEADHAAEGE